MMGPTDPMQYVPTWQLFIIMILIFGAIYGCGRILEYLLRQFLRCMKYLLLAFIDLYYGDDFEEASNNSNSVEDSNNKRRKREAGARRSKNPETSNNNNTSSKSVLLNTSNGTIERTTVPVETTILKVDIDNENDNVTIAEAMRHSPTDDEGNSSVSPAIRHRNNVVKHSELPESSSPVVTVVSSS
uniref:Uncharacterized protein n=1 Tax=Panagrolaimus superbus TaxID=310955 RepID=A0A914Y4M6_9BILA